MNTKKIFGSVLTILGIIGLIYCAVVFINMQGGKHDTKSVLVYGILGVVFFFAGISLIRSTKDAA